MNFALKSVSDFYTFFGPSHFSIPTKGRAVETKRNEEVPRRQVSSGDGIPSSQNTQTDFCKSSGRKDQTSKTFISCKSFRFTVRLHSYDVLLKTVLKVCYTHLYSPDSLHQHLYGLKNFLD